MNSSKYKIICASRDKRSKHLMEAMNKEFHILANYEENLSKLDKLKLYVGSLKYFYPHYKKYRQITTCSPFSVQYRARKTAKFIEKISLTQAVDFIFQWGATFPPFDHFPPPCPYFVYTDSCCDPDNPTLPWKWRPPRVARDYTKEQHKTFLHATRIFTHSAWAKNLIVKVHNINEEHIRVVGSGPAMPVPEKSIDFSQKKDQILFVGGDFFRKGVDIIREAVPFVLNEYPQAEFIIIGKNTELKLDPHPAFKLLGPIFDKQLLSQYYTQAKIFVLPSRFEPLGHVLWEAMAYSTPVIVTNIGGMPETVIEGYNGYIIPPENPKKLAETIVMILKNNDLARQLSMNARNHFETHGTWDHVLQRIAAGINLSMGP